MKINKEKVKERLKGVPEHLRSHIYDATIIIEFLNRVYMPTKYFLPEGFTPVPGEKLGFRSMKEVSKDANMSIGSLYETYIMWRQAVDYTAPIESRYTFSVIIRNLRYYKNGRELCAWRVGSAQIWYVGPLLARHKLPQVEVNFPPQSFTAPDSTVEADPIAHPVEEEQESEESEEQVPVSSDTESFTESTLDPEVEESLSVAEDLPTQETPSTGEGF